MTKHQLSFRGGFNIGGINGSGQAHKLFQRMFSTEANSSPQVPTTFGSRGLIDVDTPQSAYTKKGYYDGTEMQLVFSDEFNTDGRSFYPGDDPYWEAVDLHYWQVGYIVHY